MVHLYRFKFLKNKFTHLQSFGKSSNFQIPKVGKLNFATIGDSICPVVFSFSLCNYSMLFESKFSIAMSRFELQVKLVLY